jgi:Rhodopirellula transposase DDE domain
LSARTVIRLLHALRYSLRGNAKVTEGTQHADRDAQFRYINEEAAAFVSEGEPATGVDAKKKELVGDFQNGGQEWQPKGEPERVRVHDFIDEDLGKAIPYGIYDLKNKRAG